MQFLRDSKLDSCQRYRMCMWMWPLCGWAYALKWEIIHSSLFKLNCPLLLFLFHALCPLAGTPPHGINGSDRGSRSGHAHILLLPDLEEAWAFPFSHSLFNSGVEGPSLSFFLSHFLPEGSLYFLIILYEYHRKYSVLYKREVELTFIGTKIQISTCAHHVYHSLVRILR